MTQPYNALYGSPQAPQDNALYYDDTQGMPRQRPADPLRWLADAVGQNKDLPAPQFFMDPRALSARNMLHSALNTSANWLDGTRDPSLVGVEEMVSPLGLGLGMGGVANTVTRSAAGPTRAAAMADNAKGSAPGTVINSLDMSEAARMSRAREQGFDTERPLYHGTKADFDAFRPSEKGKFGSGVYFSPDRQFADEWTSGNGRVIEAYGRGKMADDAAWAKARDAEYSADGSRSMFEIENAAAKRLQSEGYAGVSSKARGETVVFDPRNIRSTQAAFDPAKRDSAMLLAADNAKGSAPGTVLNSMAEGASKARTLGDEFLGMGTDQTKFLPALDSLKLSKAEWDELANHYRNAPTGSTHQFKFDSIDKAKKFLRDTFIERHSAESKAARIKEMFGDKVWAAADERAGVKPPGESQASPLASAPGLAANSTQQDDQGVISILRRYGLAD